ncbi:MAG: hypothetical protein Q9195_000333 [Heterodermia aff. obscurata]
MSILHTKMGQSARGIHLLRFKQQITLGRGRHQEVIASIISSTITTFVNSLYTLLAIVAVFHHPPFFPRVDRYAIGFEQCELDCKFKSLTIEVVTSNSRNVPPPYKLDKDRVRKDLTEDRPRYILSAYGPEKDLPIQLFGGYPREQSFEELRLRHYELAFQGNQQQAIQEAQNWFNSAEQQIQTALNDVEGAIQYMINGENDHPNRIDICKQKGVTTTLDQGQGVLPRASPAFGQPTPPSAFGQPSSVGQQSSTFGQQQSTFGKPSTFGQPAHFGRPPTSFGQPTSTFGQPAALAPTFGQSSTPGPVFGQPTSSAPAFAQPSAMPAFGQASSLGNRPAIAPAFGAPSSLGSNQPPASGFASTNNAFGQTSAPAPMSTFGQTPTGPANAFGQQATPSTTSVFGQPSPAPTNPFSNPATNPTRNDSAQPDPSSSSLGKSPMQMPNAFGQASSTSERGPKEPLNTPFGTLTTSQPKVQPQQVHATYAGDRLKTWKGKPVTYDDSVPYVRSQDGELEKIHFPNGPPSLNKSPELPDELYDEATKENYRFMMAHSTFKDGLMPNLPPKREWCKWDF